MTTDLMEPKLDHELSPANYRLAWLAGYRQAVQDMHEASTQILNKPIGQVYDNSEA
jgi:hypothetical protein